MPESDYDLIVVGAGIAGLSASKEVAGSGLRVANIETAVFGGLVTNIGHLDGAITGSGAELATTLFTEISEMGVAILTEAVLQLAEADSVLTVKTDASALRARSVIVASGAKLRRLGIPGETELEYKGVSHCADCDGPMHNGSDVVVIGGGDSALQEALVLAEVCRTVNLIHRRRAFRARPQLIEQVRGRENIKIWWDCEATEIVGSDAVESLRVRTLPDGTNHTISCTGVFAYIGLEPACDFVPAAVPRDANGALITNEQLQTAIPAIYAIGAVRSGYKGTLSDAVGEARTAGRAALQRLGA